MGMCQKCSGLTGKMLIVMGILLLLRDLSVWNVWNISAWTLVFIAAGMTFWGKSCCEDCAACSGMPMKSKK